MMTALATGVSLIAPIAFGFMGSRIAPHIPIAASFLIFASCSLLFLSSTALWVQCILLVLFRFTFWGFSTLVPVGVMRLLKANVGREYGHYRRIGSFGFLGGTLLTGYVTDLYGIEVLFFMVTAAALIAGYPFARVIRIECKRAYQGSFLQLYRQKHFLLFLIGISFSWTMMPMAFVYMPLRMRELHASNLLISFAASLCGLIALLTLPSMGRFVDYFTPKKVLWMIPAGSALRVLLMYLPALNPEWFLLIQLLHIPSWVLFDVVVIKVLKGYFPAEATPQAQALVHIHSLLGSSLGAAFAAQVISLVDFRTSFIYSAVLPLIGILCVLPLCRAKELVMFGCIEQAQVKSDPGRKNTPASSPSLDRH